MGQTHRSHHHLEPEVRTAESGRRPGAVVYRDADALGRDLDRRVQVRREEERRHGAAAAPAALGVRELCHDARQSLATLRVLLQQFQQEGTTRTASHRRLVEEVDALWALVEGQLRPPPAVDVDLAQLASETVDRIGSRVGARMHVIVDGHPVVTGDRLMLGRMVMNLVDNACRQVRAGGLVRVRVDQARGKAVLDVEDEGSGQLDRQCPPPVITGQSLGLVVVQAAVTRHGGTARIDRSALGGWRVRVCLPLSSGDEVEARP